MRTVFLILSVLVITLVSFFTLKSSGIINRIVFIEPVINKDSLIKEGMPERMTNQYISIRKSPLYQNKSFFIADTRENLIYFFDKEGNFVAKSPTIDGFDKQNPKKIDEALKSWYDHVHDIGFEWDKSKKQYIDVTGKRRIYSDALVYSHLGKTGARFFPKGVYKVVRKYHYKGFVGNGDNTYDINSMDGKNMALAIHGLYQSQYRITNMNNLISLIGGNFDKMKVTKSFEKTIADNINNGVYNNSFGCINVPEKFLNMTENMAVNSILFVLGESEIDYIVK